MPAVTEEEAQIPVDPAPEAAAEPVEDPAPEATAEPVEDLTPEAEAPAEAAEAAEPMDDEDDEDDADQDEDRGSVETGEEKIEVGGDVFVNVTRITPYGAFVTLTDGRTGLIHISEIDRNYVKDVREHLREGDRVEARITAIKEDGKIDLSVKAMQDPQPRMQRGRDPEFEQKLKKFLRSSDERQVDVKRAQRDKRR